MGRYRSIVKIFVLTGALFLSASSVYAETAWEHYINGVALARKGDDTQAIAEFTKAIEIDPYMWEAYLWRGDVYVEPQHKFSQALSDYAQAIKIKPNYADPYFRRAHVFTKQGNTAQAIIEYTKVIEMNPNNDFAYLSRSAAYLAAKEYDKAWQDLHKAESLGAKIPQGLIEYYKEASGRDK